MHVDVCSWIFFEGLENGLWRSKSFFWGQEEWTEGIMCWHRSPIFFFLSSWQGDPGVAGPPGEAGVDGSDVSDTFILFHCIIVVIQQFCISSLVTSVTCGNECYTFSKTHSLMVDDVWTLSTLCPFHEPNITHAQTHTPSPTTPRQSSADKTRRIGLHVNKLHNYYALVQGFQQFW